MIRKYVFADESGCMTFKRGDGASKYFIVCTITTRSCDVAHSLLALRRRLVWDQVSLGDYFHAAKDANPLREAVFAEMLSHDFSVQATIMEKSKAQPQVRAAPHQLYKYGWYYHFKNSIAKDIRSRDELHITTATIGTKKGQAAFTSAVNDVARQCMPISRQQWRTDFCPASADPCLQVADYCSWAIQRKWEKGDGSWHDLIRDRISYEFDLWSHGTHHFY